MTTLKNVCRFIHRYAGWVAGVFFFILCLSGAILVIQPDVEHMLEPTRYAVPAHDADAQMMEPGEFIKAFEKQEAETFEEPTTIHVQRLQAYVNPKKAWYALVSAKNDRRTWAYIAYADPFTAKGVAYGPTKDAMFFRIVRFFHMFMISPSTRNGGVIAGYFSLIAALALISGLIRWYPMKWKNNPSLKNSFRPSVGKGGFRTNYDWHNVGGFYAMIFLLLLCLTGAWISVGWFRNCCDAVIGYDSSKGSAGMPGVADASSLMKGARGGMHGMPGGKGPEGMPEGMKKAMAEGKGPEGMPEEMKKAMAEGKGPKGMPEEMKKAMAEGKGPEGMPEEMKKAMAEGKGPEGMPEDVKKALAEGKKPEGRGGRPEGRGGRPDGKSGGASGAPNFAAMMGSQDDEGVSPTAYGTGILARRSPVGAGISPHAMAALMMNNAYECEEVLDTNVDISEIFKAQKEMTPNFKGYDVIIPVAGTKRAITITNFGTCLGFYFPDMYYWDQYTGKFLGKTSFSDKPVSEQIRSMIIPFHTGKLFGALNRYILFLACLIGVILCITGYVLAIYRYVNKFRAKKTAKAAAEKLASNGAEQNAEPAASESSKA